MGIFGPSGSGKTSLLNALSLRGRAQEGVVRVGGEVVKKANKRVGFVGEFLFYFILFCFVLFLIFFFFFFFKFNFISFFFFSLHQICPPTRYLSALFNCLENFI